MYIKIYSLELRARQTPIREVIEEIYAPYMLVVFDTRFQPTVYPKD